MKNKPLLIFSLAASFIVAACGGGGDATSSSTSGSTPAASPATSTPATTSTPAPIGEPLPSLASPQAGSTAAAGNGVEGIWSSQSTVSRTIAFIDPLGNLSAMDTVGTMVTSQLFGAITTSTTNWSLTSGVRFSGGVYFPTTSGSGSFTAKQAFSGSYVSNGTTYSPSWTFDAANALAVTQASVAGSWEQSANSLSVASDGTLTGKLSGCTVSGTLLLATPASSKNLYTLSVTGTPSAGCSMQAGVTYAGNAAIAFLPVTNSNLYIRTLIYLIKAPDNSLLAYGQFSKQ